MSRACNTKVVFNKPGVLALISRKINSLSKEERLRFGLNWEAGSKYIAIIRTYGNNAEFVMGVRCTTKYNSRWSEKCWPIENQGFVRGQLKRQPACKECAEWPDENDLNETEVLHFQPETSMPKHTHLVFQELIIMPQQYLSKLPFLRRESQPHDKMCLSDRSLERINQKFGRELKRTEEESLLLQPYLVRLATPREICVEPVTESGSSTHVSTPRLDDTVNPLTRGRPSSIQLNQEILRQAGPAEPSPQPSEVHTVDSGSSRKTTKSIANALVNKIKAVRSEAGHRGELFRQVMLSGWRALKTGKAASPVDHDRETCLLCGAVTDRFGTHN